MQGYEIPLIAAPQRFGIRLGSQSYQLTFQFRNPGEPGIDGSWIMDIADAFGIPMICGIPLVTGADLLAQYAYLGFEGQLRVASDGEPDAVPTFTNLGSLSHLYFITVP